MKTKLGRACFAGFLGTIVVTCMVTFASPYLIGGPSDIAAMLAGLMGGSWLAGMGMHFMVGTLILPMLYVLLDRRLPGGPALRGTAWGLMLWMVSQAVVIPATGPEERRRTVSSWPKRDRRSCSSPGRSWCFS